VNYGSERFAEIQRETKIFLRTIGYIVSQIPFIPISGLQGENLIEPSEKIKWYNGDTLISALDKVKPPPRLKNLPLRLPITNVFKISGVGTVPLGRVHTGILKPGTMIYFAPSGLTSECKSIQMHHSTCEQAMPGDNVGINVSNLAVKDIKRGYVASDANNNPAAQVERFMAQVIVMNHPNQITAGYCPILDCHTTHIRCKFEKLLSKIDKRTGKIATENPKGIKNGDACVVELVPQKPMCVESYKEFPALGRFVIRDMMQTVAIGIIKSVVKKTAK
jgi:elongation factor 1-alpha